MVLLGDEARLEDCFSPFGDSTNLNAREVYGLRRTYHRLRNCLRAPDVLLGDVGHVESRSVHRLNWKLISVHLEIVLILTQDRCTVCAERTIGSEIILDAPDGTPR